MKLRNTVICTLALACTLAAQAQSRGLRDFGFVRETTPALMLSNPATTGFWSGKVSYVEAFGNKGNGSLISLEQSPDDFSFGARTESYYRVSEFMVFHGKLSWSHFEGKDMGGQVMIQPQLNPIGFLETDLTTLGTKKRELYDLAGGLAINLGRDWAIGVNIDYGAGDQTKIKDPRFSNILMDLDIDAGVVWHPSLNLMLGLSLKYRDLLEQLRGGIYGATDRQYSVYTDRGGFWGTMEELNGDYNIVSTSNYRPMDNRYLGASLQAVFFGTFSNEFSYSKRDGYYGKKSTTTPVYYEFAGFDASYEGSLLLHSGSSLHRISADFTYSKLGNEENKYRYNTPSGGNTVVEYTGQNHIMDRSDIDASLGYRWYMGVRGPRPSFTLGAKASYFSRKQKTTIYPFYRDHSYRRIRGDIFAEKVFTAGPMSYIAGISAAFQTGSGVKKSDGSYAPGSSSRLRSFDGYLDRQYEYETDPRLGGGLSFTVARNFSDKVEVYLKLSDSLTSLLYTPQFLSGRMHNIAELTLGCNF